MDDKLLLKAGNSEPRPGKEMSLHDLLSINHFLKKILKNIFKEIYQNQLQQVSEARKS